ncbi:hypothetical protein F8388_001031 [Cannabis sativa]|uniref:Beta-galactosidase n=1 Tax=Cannabis sativa TaxID=3483 RepID=A0A7J6DZB8_CANSA|nr:hypothetical protein F8388_001031 [Cannabis sativa]
MKMKLWYIMLLLVYLGLGLGLVEMAMGKEVSYDGRSLIINGQHTLLFSGSIHYPRSTPQMWHSLIGKAKEGGLDVIQTYVFWNIHEPKQGQYDFSGRKDLVKFIKEIQAQGLYASLRIGPFIESEWSYGGLPFWLHDIPGIVYRTDNEPFKEQMQRFTNKIVSMMKEERLFASQGGPIIISQIENEYNTVERAFHEKGVSYVKWAASMAVGLQTGVPWVMCKQDDAPDPIINTCNGMRCGETFVGPNSPNKPSLWTENWTSFYQAFGDEEYIRPAQDIAFHVALFIAKKGSFVNYYMYHGGTNFERTASAFVTTKYYDQAPLDEYGLISEPKWGHLKELHAVIKLCSKTLLSKEQTSFPLDELHQAYVYGDYNSEECVAFLVNSHMKDVTVQFHNVSYFLPHNSISILPDCKNIAFNTAKAVPNFDTTSLRANMLLEHMNTTKDESDYLWYTFRFQQDSPNPQASLVIKSAGHVLRAAHGSHQNPRFSLENTIALSKGMNYISLLSQTVGLVDSGAYMESKVAGLRSVTIEDNDLRIYSWGYQVGLVGEKLEIYSDVGARNVQWNKYNVPRSFLKPSKNLLILLEEENGNPLGISIDKVLRARACGLVSESHLPPVRSWVEEKERQGKNDKHRNLKRVSPSIQLRCPRGKNISQILFASYGTPSGNCESYAQGSCHAFNSKTIVEQACLGKGSCSISATSGNFGDPCPGLSKTLVVDAQCK